jgi:hypothetical protein
VSPYCRSLRFIVKLLQEPLWQKSLALERGLGLGNELDELVLVGAPVGPANGDDREGVGVVSNPGGYHVRSLW